MKEYLKNLLPRLSQFSESLDKKELFIEQPWVFVDDELNKYLYFFKRSGDFLLSVNGNVEKGTWEYIVGTNSLVIFLEKGKLLFRTIFSSKGLVIFQKDNHFDIPMLLVNENIVPDLDGEKYLKTLVSQKTNTRWVTLETGVSLEYTVNTENPVITPGTRFDNSRIVEDGIYNIDDSSVYLHIIDNIVRRKIISVVLRSDKGRLNIFVDHGREEFLVGDETFLGDQKAPDNIYYFKDDVYFNEKIKFIKTVDGRISLVQKKMDTSLLLIIITLSILILVLYLLKNFL